jgi:hypothetical protein
VAVLVREADADHAPVAQAHLAGALDLEEELGHRVVDPEQLDARPSRAPRSISARAG